jgi:probable rRNA maturation factor
MPDRYPYLAQRLVSADRNLDLREVLDWSERYFRGKDKVTDVISFGWQEDSLVPSDVLGEIYICYKQIERQAKHFKCSTKEEFTRMLAHGLLHSVGYDHISKSQASRMFQTIQEEQQQ